MNNDHKPKDPLKVIVNYPPAAKPFEDADASRDETLGALKKRVLDAFRLTEGSQPDGSVTTCTLYHEKQPLDDLSQTLGAIAGKHPVLKLKLGQQIVQGDARAELSAMNLADDLAEARGTEDASRWEFTLAASLEIHVMMSSVAAPAERFQARLLWTAYPDEPPSLKFRDPATGSLNQPQAWPKVRGFRPQSLDACVNWTAEGLAIHPEWRTDARYRWDTRGNVLLKVLRILQSELDDHYTGRFP